MYKLDRAINLKARQKTSSILEDSGKQEKVDPHSGSRRWNFLVVQSTQQVYDVLMIDRSPGVESVLSYHTSEGTVALNLDKTLIRWQCRLRTRLQIALPGTPQRTSRRSVHIFSPGGEPCPRQLPVRRVQAGGLPADNSDYLSPSDQYIP